jgi:hypothetical protein
MKAVFWPDECYREENRQELSKNQEQSFTHREENRQELSKNQEQSFTHREEHRQELNKNTPSHTVRATGLYGITTEIN